MEKIFFKAGEVIIKEGDDGGTAFFIVSGSVEVTVGEGEYAKSVGTLEAGNVFGEMSLIDPGPRSATIRAVTDTECTATTYNEFIQSLQDNPQQAIHFMKTLVHRLRQMNQLIRNMDPGKRRLRDIFKDLTIDTKNDNEGKSDSSERDAKLHYAMMHPWVF